VARRAPVAVLAAVLLLSASGLMFELTLTRIFSATIWYHYTFVAVSVALFGWGLGGFLVYLLRRPRPEAGDTHEVHSSGLILLAILLAVVLWLFPRAILLFPFTPERLNFYFLLSVLPFVIGGAALSLAFDRHAADSNRLYFVDLVGAAAGTLLVPIAISSLGAETAVLAIGILPALAAVLLAAAVRRRRTLYFSVSAAMLVGSLFAAAHNHRSGALAIRDAPSKGLYQLLRAAPQASITRDAWNSFSRVSMVEGFDDFHLARLYIDSDAWTNVLRWDGTREDLAEARQWFRYFPLRLAEQPHVLVIGPGGGTDVVLSVTAGSPMVTAVEMNPLIVDCVRQLGPAAGQLYDHPNVRLVMDEGRNFIERTDERFDLIILGFVDSWAAISSGGLSLTENYLYTQDAMAAYYDHLTDNGALVVIRWPIDVPRLVANSAALLTERGVAIKDAGRHVLAVSEWKPAGDEPVETVFMLTRSPLAEPQVEALLAGHGRAHVLYAPDKPSEAVYSKLFAGELSLDDYADSFATLATPVVDDRPFYFATDKPLGIPDFMVRLVRIPVIAAIGFGGLVLVLARARRSRSSLGIVGDRSGGSLPGVPSTRTVTYFTALGLGFIVCEIALLQRLIMLLGHPIYTLVVILFTILLAGGLGSLFARRFAPERIHAALGWIIPCVVVLIVAAAFAFQSLIRSALPLSLPARIVITGMLVFPFGFLMGMPFPLGLRREASDPAGSPASVLWGINGVASVVGSMGAVALAVAAGFTWVFLAGATCYVIAWLTRPGRRSVTRSAGP